MKNSYDLSSINDVNVIFKKLTFDHNPLLENVFEHIFYEFKMFYRLSHWILKFLGQKHPDIQNALLESYRLHLRCVSDFFKDSSRYDDILVKDILIDDVYDVNDYAPLSIKARIGIDKSTAHISKMRLTMSSEIQEDIFRNDDYIKQVSNIRKFLALLAIDNIQIDYKNSFLESGIQTKLKELTKEFLV